MLGRDCTQRMHESEDLPYGIRYDLSEGEGMFWRTDEGATLAEQNVGFALVSLRENLICVTLE